MILWIYQVVAYISYNYWCVHNAFSTDVQQSAILVILKKEFIVKCLEWDKSFRSRQYEFQNWSRKSNPAQFQGGLINKQIQTDFPPSAWVNRQMTRELQGSLPRFMRYCTPLWEFIDDMNFTGIDRLQGRPVIFFIRLIHQ